MLIGFCCEGLTVILDNVCFLNSCYLYPIVMRVRVILDSVSFLTSWCLYPFVVRRVRVMLENVSFLTSWCLYHFHLPFILLSHDLTDIVKG